MTSSANDLRDSLERSLANGNGVLALEPAWVARNGVPPGKRFGLLDDAYQLGDRGQITERWLASTTRAENAVGPSDEGLSYIATDDGSRLTLRDAVRVAGASLMGEGYAALHPGLGRLAKVLDYGVRIPFHIHPRAEHAELVGRQPKEEAYYFLPGADTGPQPETFFGVHHSVAAPGGREQLLPYLVDWNSDLILRHSRAYLLVPDDGFHVPAGVLHAPGTALTFELQEESDTAAIFQAVCAGRVLPKQSALFRDVRPEDQRKYGERFLLSWVDWPLNGDPTFYENRHLGPLAIDPRKKSGSESWIVYNTLKFSAKKLIVPPGETFLSVERGIYSVFVWQGTGTVAGRPVRAGDPNQDELVITHHTATSWHDIVNTGRNDLFLVKYFGPDINPEAPFLTNSDVASDGLALN